MSSPYPASELTKDSHSSCRYFHGKECCRKANILIWKGRNGRVALKGRETKGKRGNKRNVMKPGKVYNYMILILYKK